MTTQIVLNNILICPVKWSLRISLELVFSYFFKSKQFFLMVKTVLGVKSWITTRLEDIRIYVLLHLSALLQRNTD